MREVYEDRLFAHGYLVASDTHADAEAVVASLAHLFGVCVTEGAHLLGTEAIAVCERNLGKQVPEPFYRGFPESVMRLSQTELALNQLLHYLTTYGLGDFSTPGHALIEDAIERVALDQAPRVLRMRVVSEVEAIELIVGEVRQLLASTRPVTDTELALIADVIRDFDLDDVSCASKDTAARLVVLTRDERLFSLVRLADVIRVTEWLQWTAYGADDLLHLNLKNRDRKLLASLIDYQFAHGHPDIRPCLEKRRVWRGLLHHLHYRPQTPEARAFVDAMRSREPRSDSSLFEALMAAGDVVGAARVLRTHKGPAAVARNLVYLLSHATTPDQVDAVLSLAAGAGKIVLVQLLLMFAHARAGVPRTFLFVRLGLMHVHVESDDECGRRRSVVAPKIASYVRAAIYGMLREACAGTLGRVYVADEMTRVALPLGMASAQEGLGALPCGSRVGLGDLPSGGCVRAFAWWKGVDDIDLSCFGLGGEKVYEFSWRTMSKMQERRDELIFSGDETSGFKGGSEYFDLDVDAFLTAWPEVRYVVFCANVFTGEFFSEGTCRAGYMLRERPASGEVFEPSTVRSSIAVAADATFVVLFAVDLERREIVWLNIARSTMERVAGLSELAWLTDKLDVCDTYNLADFARMLATEVVDTPGEADVVFADGDYCLEEGQEQIRSVDTARVRTLLEG